jgi:hypothetical protein
MCASAERAERQKSVRVNAQGQRRMFEYDGMSLPLCVRSVVLMRTRLGRARRG